MSDAIKNTTRRFHEEIFLKSRLVGRIYTSAPASTWDAQLPDKEMMFTAVSRAEAIKWLIDTNSHRRNA